MENVRLAGPETIKLFNDRENVREKPRLMIPTINSCVWRWALNPAQMLRFVLAWCFPPTSDRRVNLSERERWRRSMVEDHGCFTFSGVT